MTNFYEETIETLEWHGKTPDDILWTGTFRDGHYVKFGHKGKTIDEFMRELFNFNYDDDYGKQVIDPWLIIVGKGDWYMERGEDDGSEWWNYNRKPNYPDTEISSPNIKDVVANYAHEGDDYIVPKKP